MPDGPFKNSKLVRRWKRYANAIYLENFDNEHCGALASDAIVRDILTPENQSAIHKLRVQSNTQQMEMQPGISVETLLGGTKTPFVDKLFKQLAPSLYKRQLSDEIINQALEASIVDQLGVAKSRIEEECLVAFNSGKKKNELTRVLRQNNEVFKAMDKAKLFDAVRNGKINMFKNQASKKQGLNDGPSL